MEPLYRIRLYQGQKYIGTWAYAFSWTQLLQRVKDFCEKRRKGYISFEYQIHVVRTS